MAKRSTKQQLMLSAISLLLCVSMLVGSTFAWFTDSVTSTNNIIKSGTLDVELEYSTNMTTWTTVDANSKIFSEETLWEPGHTEVVYLRVSNAGTLALKYNLGINIVEEIQGKNVAGELFNLSDYIYFDVIENPAKFTDRAAARAAATAPVAIKAGYANGGSLLAKTASNAENPSDVVAVVVYMPENVGNEANYRTDATYTNVPYIKLGINLFATQVESEVDSFDKYYDANSTYPGGAFAYVDDNVSAYSLVVPTAENPNNSIGSAVVPKGAVADDADVISIHITKTAYDGNFTIPAGFETLSYDVKVDGLKAGNTIPVKVTLKVPAGLDPATVELYHYDTKIDCTYDPVDGVVTFETATFSPFTAVYDAESVYVPPVIDEDDELPEATVVRSNEFENTDLPWGSYGAWSPTPGLDSQLEAAYTFTAPHKAETVDTCAYKDWYCDFYVKLDKALGSNQIFLGGNYGSFGWVGFHNGDLTLDANTEIPLLGSVTENPWTYTDVATYVGTFICGVGDVDNALAGATFTVMLRLTNPENENEFYNVSTIEHTFAAPEEVADNAEFTTAVVGGESELVLNAGNYTMPDGSDSADLRGKTITISGTKDTVIDVANVNANDQFVTGANITFEGVTLNFGVENYMGFANAKRLTFKDCKITGLQFLYSDYVTFENCVIDSSANTVEPHAIWTYGAENISFTNCDFIYGNRGINCYGDNDVEGGKQIVNFKNCTFTTTDNNSEGAVEINSSMFSVGIEVNMEGCTAPANGKLAYVSQWDSTNGAKTTINIK